FPNGTISSVSRRVILTPIEQQKRLQFRHKSYSFRVPCLSTVRVCSIHHLFDYPISFSHRRYVVVPTVIPLGLIISATPSTTDTSSWMRRPRTGTAVLSGCTSVDSHTGEGLGSRCRSSGSVGPTKP